MTSFGSEQSYQNPQVVGCRLVFCGLWSNDIWFYNVTNLFLLSKIRIWKMWSTPYSTSYLMLLTTKDHFPQTLLTTLMCCKASETVFHSNVRKENKNSSSSSFIPSSFCEETRVGHAHSSVSVLLVLQRSNIHATKWQWKLMLLPALVSFFLLEKEDLWKMEKQKWKP